jgi:hypothetical protein
VSPQWKEVARRGAFGIAVRTLARLERDGGALPVGKAISVTVYPDDDREAFNLAFTDIATLATFCREMRPHSISVAVAPGESEAALRMALDDLIASATDASVH